MNLELTTKQFRLLLDMAYIGNWVLNSTRGEDRITDYDEVESRLFYECIKHGMGNLANFRDGTVQPSQAFVDGGIHEAVMDYEDTIFYEILAEELARRDMQSDGLAQENSDELERRVAKYISEFEHHGMEHVNVDL